MKIINYILLATIALFAMASCESDIDKMTVDSPDTATASVLTAEGVTVVEPSFENLKEFATIFNWTRTLMGSPEIPVIYTLVVDTTDRFETPLIESVGTNLLSKSFTNTALNDWGLRFSVDPANPKPVDLFVKIAGSVLSQNSAPVVAPDSIYSNFLTINVTPFLAEPAVVYIAGDFDVNGWSPENSAKLYSETRNNIYVGYVYLNTLFKVCPKPSWDGALGGGKNGDLAPGDDIASTPGFYWMEVDLNKNTYKATLVEISIVGSIYGSWDKDLVMTYNPKTNLLSATETFTKGDFKFRQDKDWNVAQFGLGTDGKLASKIFDTDANVSDIPLDQSGNLTITLNLWNYLDPTYSVKAN